MVELVVIGGGNMGEALVSGLIGAGWAEASAITVVEADPDRRAALADRYPGLAVADAPVAAAGALVAVKPPMVADVCAGLGELGIARVLSVAAGVHIATMEAVLPAGVAVVRAMPNTPALVGKGAAAIAGGTSATDDDLAWAESILGAVGTVARVTETQLEAVTGVSGSGPAYLFLVAEAMIEAGVLHGLTRTVATELVAQTMSGAGEMLATGEPAAILRGNVTSPGGTTAAGLRALEKAAVRSAFIDAVSASVERSREMG